jgi:hypothetical protein
MHSTLVNFEKESGIIAARPKSTLAAERHRGKQRKDHTQGSHHQGVAGRSNTTPVTFGLVATIHNQITADNVYNCPSGTGCCSVVLFGPHSPSCWLNHCWDRTCSHPPVARVVEGCTIGSLPCTPSHIVHRINHCT